MLSLLDTFASEGPTLTAEEISAKLGLTRGTAYRYVRELSSVGLLAGIGGAYTLGPRIIELDYCIRRSDPMLHASLSVLQLLRDRFECDVLLTTFYEDRVVVTHHEHSVGDLQVSYGRGRVMPLFYGAGSKAILAALPNVKQRRLFAAHQEEIARAGMGDNWTAFRSALSSIRRAGFVISYGELDQGNVGVSAPICVEKANAFGSIVMVFKENRFEVLDKKLLAQTLVKEARRIVESLSTGKATAAERAGSEARAESR